MRLIDGDELKLKLPNTYHNGFENCRECRLLEREEVNAYIDRMPTVDAVPVVHGEWIECDDYGDIHYQCSECGDECYSEDGTPSENFMYYCPRCGAKMDLEETKNNGTDNP